MGNLRMNADQISYKGGKKPMSVEEAIKNAGNTGLAHTADIAPDFSTESAYNAGDLVYHNGTLYVFTSNHAAGAWSTDDTQAVTVGGELADVKSGLIKKTHYTLTTDTDGDVAINISVGNIVAIIPDRSKGDDGCYTSWFTALLSINTQGTFYSIKFVDSALNKIASTKIAFDVLYT